MYMYARNTAESTGMLLLSNVRDRIFDSEMKDSPVKS
jgi:hypothetical protein